MASTVSSPLFNALLATPPVVRASDCKQAVSDKAIVLDSAQKECLKYLLSQPCKCKIGDKWVSIDSRKLFDAFQRLLKLRGVSIDDLILSGGRVVDVLFSSIRVSSSDVDVLGYAKGENWYAFKECFARALKEQLPLSYSQEDLLLLLEKTGCAVYSNAKLFTASLPLWVSAPGSHGKMIQVERPLDLRIELEPPEEFSCTNSGNSLGCSILSYCTDPNWDGEFVVKCKDGYEPKKSIQLLLQNRFYVLEGHAEATREGLRAYVTDRTKGKSPTDTRCEVGYIKRWKQDYGFEEGRFASFFEHLEKYLNRHFNKLSTPEDRLGAAHYLLNLRSMFVSDKTPHEWVDKLGEYSACILDREQPYFGRLLLLILFWSKQPDGSGEIPWINTLDLLHQTDENLAPFCAKFGNLLKYARLPFSSARIKEFLQGKIESLPKSSENPRAKLLHLFAQPHRCSQPSLIIDVIADALPELDVCEINRVVQSLVKAGGDARQIGNILSSLAEGSLGRLPFLQALLARGDSKVKKGWQKPIFNALCKLLPIPPSPNLPPFSFDEWRRLYVIAPQLPDDLPVKLIERLDRHFLFQVHRQDETDVKKYTGIFDRPLDVFKMVLELPSNRKQFLKLTFLLLEKEPKYLSDLVALTQKLDPNNRIAERLAEIPTASDKRLALLVNAFAPLESWSEGLTEILFGITKNGNKGALPHLIARLSQSKEPIAPELLTEMSESPLTPYLAPALVKRSELPSPLLTKLLLDLAKKGDEESLARLANRLSQVSNPIPPEFLTEIAESPLALRLGLLLVKRPDTPPPLSVELLVALVKEGNREAAVRLADRLAADPTTIQLIAEPSRRSILIQLLSERQLRPTEAWQYGAEILKQPNGMAWALKLSRICLREEQKAMAPIEKYWMERLKDPSVSLHDIDQIRAAMVHSTQHFQTVLQQKIESFPLPVLARHRAKAQQDPGIWMQRFEKAPSLEGYKALLKSFPRAQWPLLTEGALKAARKSKMTSLFSSIWAVAYEYECLTKEMGKTLLKEFNPDFLTHKQRSLLSVQAILRLFEMDDEAGAREMIDLLLEKLPLEQLADNDVLEAVWKGLRVAAHLPLRSDRLPLHEKGAILKRVLERPFNKQLFLRDLLLSKPLLGKEAVAFLPFVKQPSLDAAFADKTGFTERLQGLLQSVKGAEEWKTELLSLLLSLTESAEHKKEATQSLFDLIPTLHSSQIEAKQFDSLLRLSLNPTLQGAIAQLSVGNPAVLERYCQTMGKYSLAFLETLSLPPPDPEKFSSIGKKVCGENPPLAIKIALQLNRLGSLEKPQEFIKELVILGKNRLAEEFSLLEEIFKQNFLDPEELWTALFSPTATLRSQIRLATLCLQKKGKAIQTIENHFANLDAKSLIQFFQTWDGPFSLLLVRLVNTALKSHDKQLNGAVLKFFLEKQKLFNSLPLNDFWTLCPKFLRLSEMCQVRSIDERTQMRESKNSPDGVPASEIASFIKETISDFATAPIKSSKEAEGIYHLLLQRVSQSTPSDICSKLMALFSDETIHPSVRRDFRARTMKTFWSAVGKMGDDPSRFWSLAESLLSEPWISERDNWDELFRLIDLVVEKNPNIGETREFFQKASLPQSLQFFLKNQEVFSDLPFKDFWDLSLRFLSMPEMIDENRLSQQGSAICDLMFKKLLGSQLSARETSWGFVELFSNGKIPRLIRNLFYERNKDVFWSSIEKIGEESTLSDFWEIAGQLIPIHSEGWEKIFPIVNRAIDKNKKSAHPDPLFCLGVRSKFFQHIPPSGFDSLRARALDLFWSEANWVPEGENSNPALYRLSGDLFSDNWMSEFEGGIQCKKLWEYCTSRLESPLVTPELKLSILIQLWVRLPPPFVEEIYPHALRIFWENLDPFYSSLNSNGHPSLFNNFWSDIVLFMAEDQSVLLEKRGDWKKIFYYFLDKPVSSDQDFKLVALSQILDFYSLAVEEKDADERPLLAAQVPLLLCLAEKATDLIRSIDLTSKDSLEKAASTWEYLVQFLSRSFLSPASAEYERVMVHLRIQHELLTKAQFEISGRLRVWFCNLLMELEPEKDHENMITDHLHQLFARRDPSKPGCLRGSQEPDSFSKAWMETWKELGVIQFSLRGLNRLWGIFGQTNFNRLLTPQAAISSLLIYQCSMRSFITSLLPLDQCSEEEREPVREGIYSLVEDKTKEWIATYEMCHDIPSEKTMSPDDLIAHGGVKIFENNNWLTKCSEYVSAAISIHVYILELCVAITGKKELISKLGEVLFEAQIQYPFIDAPSFLNTYNCLGRFLQNRSFLRTTLFREIDRAKIFQNLDLATKQAIFFNLVHSFTGRMDVEFDLKYGRETIAFIHSALKCKSLNAIFSPEVISEFSIALMLISQKLTEKKDESSEFLQCLTECLSCHKNVMEFASKQRIGLQENRFLNDLGKQLTISKF